MKRLCCGIFLTMEALCILSSCNPAPSVGITASENVLIRTIGREHAKLFDLKLVHYPDDSDRFTVSASNGRVSISGSSPVALCRGAYDFLKHGCASMVSWSGNHINFPDPLPEYNHQVTTPYHYRYYFNVVTHGYSMPYWGWDRWQKEIDWMAIHGINMPLLSGAYEAILSRVFTKMGLSGSELDAFFSGPAFLPWNRMGNLTGWDGPLPAEYLKKQIKLTHLILDRLRELGMHPIIPAFAGFVPEGIKRLYPSEKLRELTWGGGLDKKYRAHILEPGSALFIEIGKQYIQEWENEFGKAEFYLADSFNEMDVPLSGDSAAARKELAGYGASVFRSIHEADTAATWVMQGWTFPFQKDKNGQLFWTPDRLKALVSEIPDNKLLILDLANEYNKLWWKIDPSWKLYSGFFGKQWIYSFAPNMGGKDPWNGRLDLYATMPEEALQYKDRRSLVGFGFAPEGIENNDIIYELLSDVGWSHKAINLDHWIRDYCKQRYGMYTPAIQQAFKYLRASCYGSFTDHPRFRYQLRPDIHYDSLPFDFQSDVHSSDDFRKAVGAFLQDCDQYSGNALYKNDALFLTTQYLGLKADSLLLYWRDKTKGQDDGSFQEAMALLDDIDRLLASTSEYRLQQWIDFARNFSEDTALKHYYESDAKRLITTWGKGYNVLDDYAARTWSGLIGDYYMPRWKHYHEALKNHRPVDLAGWEETWINTPWKSHTQPFNHPLQRAETLFLKYKNGLKFGYGD